MSNANWSSDSQAHTRICVLESQLEVKGTQLGKLQEELVILKQENDRLGELVKTLTILQK